MNVISPREFRIRKIIFIALCVFAFGFIAVVSLRAQDAKPTQVVEVQKSTDPSYDIGPTVRKDQPKALTDKQKVEWLTLVNAANIAELAVRRLDEQIKAEREKRVAAQEQAMQAAITKLADLRKASSAPANCNLTNEGAWACPPVEQAKK